MFTDKKAAEEHDQLLELVDGITCMLEANLKTSFPKDLTITLSSLGVKSGTLDET